MKGAPLIEIPLLILNIRLGCYFLPKKNTQHMSPKPHISECCKTFSSFLMLLTNKLECWPIICK